jgi:hypothetical protein
MYTDYYLRFSDQEQATGVLYTTHPAVTDDDGNVLVEGYLTPNYANIDVLGVLYERNDDPEAEPVPLQGWHVNVRVLSGEESAILDQYAVNPTLPRRVWG